MGRRSVSIFGFWVAPLGPAFPNFRVSYISGRHERQDGTSAGVVAIGYSLGHPKRTIEGVPALYQKLESNLRSVFTRDKAAEVISPCKASGGFGHARKFVSST